MKQKKSSKNKEQSNLFKQTTRIFLIGFLTSEIVSLIFLGLISKAHNEIPLPFIEYKPSEKTEQQVPENENKTQSLNSLNQQ